MPPPEVMGTPTAALVPVADEATAREIDGKLRGLVTTMTQHFLVFMDLADRVIAERTYIAMGFSKVDEYFASVGMAWRTVRRYIPLSDALKRLPEPDRHDVRERLGALGSHKAVVLAPVIGQPDQPWQKLLDQAPRLVEEDLQIQVSRLTGRSRQRAVAPRSTTYASPAAPSPAGNGYAAEPPGEPESQWLRYTLRLIREEGKQAEVRNVFAAGRHVIGRTREGVVSDLEVLLTMVEECKVELYADAQADGWEPPYAESGEHVNQATEG